MDYAAKNVICRRGFAAAAAQAAMSALARTFCHGKHRSQWREGQNVTLGWVTSVSRVARKERGCGDCDDNNRRPTAKRVFQRSVDVCQGSLLESKPDRYFLGWRKDLH